ncbi:MAG: carbon-nitrogen hydrolase family protein [bacterium]|nr:carbon-nitrogen hydrolase family protein [bacterium]
MTTAAAKSTLVASAIQMISSADLDLNLKTAERLLRQAKDKGCELAVLPENFALMGRSEKDKLAISESEGVGPIQEFLGRMSSELSLWIVGGTIPLNDPEDAGTRVRASSLVYTPTGKRICRYDKIHLFDVSLPESKASSAESYKESASIAPGDTPTGFTMPETTVGLSVCYDLRFPELFRLLAKNGAEILVVPSAFTKTTGARHWEILLRARAIENLCFVIGSNQGGLHDNGRETYGHSMIIDYWGGILASTDFGSEAVVTAKLDLDELRNARHKFPTLNHRRL